MLLYRDSVASFWCDKLDCSMRIWRHHYAVSDHHGLAHNANNITARNMIACAKLLFRLEIPLFGSAEGVHVYS